MARRKGRKAGNSARTPRKGGAGKSRKGAAAKTKGRISKIARKAAPVSPERRRPRKSFLRRVPAAASRLVQRLKPTLAGNPYACGLDRDPANYQPLTPLTFLERAASVFPDRTAIVHGTQRFSYAQFYARARQLASALAQRGIG